MQPTSATVIQHPTLSNEPAYKVQILQPAPNIHTASALAITFLRMHTSLRTHSRSILEVATIFIKSLIQSVQDFLRSRGRCQRPIYVHRHQRTALDNAVDAGVNVQLLGEAGAAAATTASKLIVPYSLWISVPPLFFSLLLSIQEGLN